MPDNQHRKLAAILAADIAGYSALMGADEDGTVRDLKAHQAVILPMIGEYSGRIIDTAGDGILAEFASVVNAVQCAVAIQKTMAERNASIGHARRMQFRIGVNLGDVIQDEARVYGDGVNIAARLEAISEPGGICLSSAVHDQVRKKLPLTFTDLGMQSLKNIAEPIRVFRVDGGPSATPELGTKVQPALPDKPSIAVLPFANLGGDPSHEYFSDGITEDIITELSRFSELFVIARNSSFQYKGKAADVRQVGRELGVRYLLEGSIRRAAARVRITAQLVDAVTGAHLWAERYDRQVEDVFAIQDEVAGAIVAILTVHVHKAEIGRSVSKPPATWYAYDHYLKAIESLHLYWSSFEMKDLHETRHFLEQSLTLDPNYARAHAALSYTYATAFVNPLGQDYLNPASLNRAHQSARRAVQLDPNSPNAHASLGLVLLWEREHDASLAAFERAIALNRNFTDWRIAMPLLYSGKFEMTIRALERHIRFDPFYPALALGWLGFAYYMLGRYAEALVPLGEAVSRVPNSRSPHIWLAATYGQLGYRDKAEKEAAEILRIEPTWTIAGTARRLHVFKNPSEGEVFFDGLLKAGLPEK